MHRRNFLKLAAGALVLGPVRLLASDGRQLLLSCRADTANHYFLSAVDAAGRLHFDIPLPARGHGVTVRPGHGECVVFARRPGDYLWAVNLASGQVSHRIQAPAERRYYGHGVFEPAGRLLYVTENDFEAGRGVIGVYDAADGYKRLGELPGHGVGPHELKMLGDGRTLVIANGGIQTHPDMGRSKLNLPDMDPNLAYVDRHDGKLLGAYRPPAQWHQLSIRHLDVGPDDTVCVGMQYQGPKTHRPPLVALHRGQDGLQLVSAPDDIQARMTNYCGSVTCDSSGALFAISSPRGGIVTAWSARDGGYLGHVELADGCGIAAGQAARELLVSSGTGDIVRFGAGLARGDYADLSSLGVRWDNHMIRTYI